MIVSIPILSIRSSDMPSASQMHKRLRYFTMVNALVVPLVKAMGKRISALAEDEQRSWWAFLLGFQRGAPLQCHLSVDDLRRRHQGGAGDHRTRQCGYAGEHLRPYPAVLPCGAGQEVWKRLLCQARHLQPAGCTRRRRTHHLHDGSFGIAQGCRPGNEGKAPPSTAHLMQKRALIAMQYSALHNRTWKTPTVQKPCSHGLQNKKAMKSFDPQLPR